MLKKDIPLKLSKTYLVFVLFMAILSFYSIFLLPIAFLMQLGLCIFTTSYSLYLIFSMQNFKMLKPLEENTWQLSTRKKSYIGYLCGDSTVTHFVCILRFKVAHSRFQQTCFVFRDSVPPNVYRRLLVELYAAGHLL